MSRRPSIRPEGSSFCSFSYDIASATAAGDATNEPSLAVGKAVTRSRRDCGSHEPKSRWPENGRALVGVMVHWPAVALGVITLIRVVHDVIMTYHGAESSRQADYFSRAAVGWSVAS